MTSQNNSVLGNIRTTTNVRVAQAVKNITLGSTTQPGVLDFTNSNGSIIIDYLGLNSANTFSSDQIINSTGYSTASTSFVDVTGSTMDSFTLSRTTRVLISLQAQMYNDAFLNNMSHGRLSVNDSQQGSVISIDYSGDWKLDSISQDGTMAITGWGATLEYRYQGIMAIFSLVSGAHVLKLQYKSVSSGTTYIGAYVLSYIILGA